jgi:beta-lactamase class A
MSFTNLSRRVLLRTAPLGLATQAEARSIPLALKTILQDYERQTGGHVGLYAENTRTGAKLTWRDRQRFVMCSTFKASLAACILRRADRGQENLADMIRFSQADIGDMYAPIAQANLAKGALSVTDMCQAAVEYSDNLCANALLARIGGPPAMTAFWRSIGDPVSRLDHNEPLLNRSPPGDPRDTTTPRAMAGNLHRLVLGDILLPPSRQRFTNWLIGCQTGADRLRAGLPQGWVIGDKTGNNGKDAAGDIAIAWKQPNTPILISAYTQGGTPTEAQFKTLFTQIGQAAGIYL